VPINSPVPRTPKNKYYDPHIDVYPFNPAAGKRLREEHGWRENAQGVMTKNGKTLAFTLIYPTGSVTQSHVVQLLKVEWAKEGIDVTLEGTPFEQVVTDETEPAKWDMAWSNGWAYEPDYYPTGGGLFRAGAAADYGGYDNATMNTLINATYAPSTPAQAMQRLFAYEVFASKHLPVLWMPEPTGYQVVAPWLHGYNAWFNPITTYNYPNHWTISPNG
jgi:peptide/nickel transport system substrate-binding protein